MAHRLTRANWLWQVAFLLFMLSSGLFAFFHSDLDWWRILLHAVLVGGNAVLLQLLVRQFELLGSLSIFPATIYFLLNAFCPNFILEPQAYLASACLMMTCLSIFNCYQQNECRVKVYNAYFFLCLAGICIPGLLLLIPIIWISFNLINTLNIKRWLASLLAVITVVGSICALAFVFDAEQRLLLIFTRSVENFYAAIFLKAEEWIFLAGLTVLSIIGIFHFLNQGQRSRRNSIRYFNSFLIIIGLFCVAMMFLFSPLRHQYLILAALPFSIILGMYFNDVQQLFSRILMILSLAVGCVYCLSFI